MSIFHFSPIAKHKYHTGYAHKPYRQQLVVNHLGKGLSLRNPLTNLLKGGFLSDDGVPSNVIGGNAVVEEVVRVAIGEFWNGIDTNSFEKYSEPFRHCSDSHQVHIVGQIIDPPALDASFSSQLLPKRTGLYQLQEVRSCG